MGDGIERLVFKIVVAFIFAIIVYFIVRPVFSFFGMVLCSGCDPLTSAFAMIIVPIALAFVAIYRIVEVFQR